MKRLLAWDTSSKTGAIVALEWDAAAGGGDSSWNDVRLVTELTLNVDSSSHSDRLLWGIHQSLEAARWRLEEVDVFAVGIGPGSFTGLRIGVTTARTMAHTLQKPLVGVSSLAALARPVAMNLSQGPEPVLVIAATDACKGELFALWGDAKAIAKSNDPDHWPRGVYEGVWTPPELMQKLNRRLHPEGSARKSKSRWVVVGEGRERYQDAWAQLPARQRLEAPGIFEDKIQGRYLGMLAWERVKQGLCEKALEVKPRYLGA